jgi:serine/threonine-protein kinase
MPLGHEEYKRIPTQTSSTPDESIEPAALETQTVIGTGGTADVIKMTDTQSGEVVAVKQPQFEETLTNQVASNFLEEAKIWKKLSSHHNIVHVVGWEEKPIPQIILEYMDGGSLTDRVGEMSHGQALWTGVCVADAVWEAHRQGVAHLDLKPDNILFRTTMGDHWDIPKVSDWGVARLLLHHSQSVSGLSPQYSAPEQFSPDTHGQPDDVTDVYQLGVIMYELLIGDPLFSGQASAVMDKHLTEAPAPPTDINTKLPASANHVLGTALAKEKNDRYESMLDFRRDLTALFRQIVLNERTRFVCQEQPTRWANTMREETSTNTARSEEIMKRTDRLKRDAAPFDSDDGASGVLDSIQTQSDSGSDHGVSWRRQDEASTVERDASGTLERDRHAISTQMNERLQEIPKQDRDSGNTTAEPIGLLWLIKRILQR